MLAGGVALMIVLLSAVPASDARKNKPKVSARAAISVSNVVTVAGRVRPPRSAWRVRIQARVSRVRSGRTRRIWVKRAESPRLRRSGRFRVTFLAGGSSATVRAVVMSRGRPIATGRVISVSRRSPPSGLTSGEVGATGTPAPPGTSPPTPSHAEPGSTLGSTSALTSGEKLVSPNKQYSLVMQASDGNLVLYKGTTALWSTGATGSGSRAVMQGDGNLVVYNGSAPKWSSSTAGFAGASLSLHDDGNLVIYHAGRGVWTWSAGYIGHHLGSGQQLPPGALLRSADGQYRMVMQGDGNLVVYRQSAALWATGGSDPGSRAVMQGDGNFVVYDGAAAKWASTSSGFGGAELVLQDDGNAVIYHGGHAIWAWSRGYIGDTLDSGAILLPGAYLKSANKQFALLMQPSDGNLALYGPAGALWSFGTTGHPGARAIMQGDGNFVVYSGQSAVRSTGTTGSGGAHLRLQDDANLVVYNGGTAVWSRMTGLIAGGGPLQLPWPAGHAHRISSFGSGYGCDYHVGATHYALDFEFSTGQPVASVAPGTARAASHSQLGNYVWVAHGEGLVSIYAHLSSFAGGLPRQVSRGETIGGAGSTGSASTGTHLHFVMRSGATGPFDGAAFKPEPMSGYSGFGAFGCGRGTSPYYTAQ